MSWQHSTWQLVWRCQTDPPAPLVSYWTLHFGSLVFSVIQNAKHLNLGRWQRNSELQFHLRKDTINHGLLQAQPGMQRTDQLSRLTWRWCWFSMWYDTAYHFKRRDNGTKILGSIHFQWWDDRSIHSLRGLYFQRSMQENKQSCLSTHVILIRISSCDF